MESDEIERVRKALRRELMALRRRREPFTEPDVAKQPTLVEVAGGGSSLSAFDRLMALRAQYGTLPLHQVNAYFQLSGHGLDGNSLQQRRERYAERYFVSDRTALRYADDGIRHITAVLLGQEPEPGSQLSATVHLFQHGNYVEGTLQFWIELETAFSPPKLWINGEALPSHTGPLSDALASEGILFGHRVIPPTQLPVERRAEEAEAPLFELRLRWDIPTLPQWSITTTLADSRLAAAVNGNLSAQATVAIDWLWPNEWFTERARPLATLPDWFVTDDPDDDFGPAIRMGVDE